MTTALQYASDSAGVMVAKVAPPAAVSIATLFGFHIAELILWGTAIYTLLMIGHKLTTIYHYWKDRKAGLCGDN